MHVSEVAKAKVDRNKAEFPLGQLKRGSPGYPKSAPVRAEKAPLQSPKMFNSAISHYRFSKKIIIWVPEMGLL